MRSKIEGAHRKIAHPTVAGKELKSHTNETTSTQEDVLTKKKEKSYHLVGASKTNTLMQRFFFVCVNHLCVILTCHLQIEQQVCEI
jgi:hypothetical protein